MSTTYTTEPPVPFEKIVAAKSVEVEPQPLGWTLLHCRLHKDGNYLYAVRNSDGSAHFERFGRNDIWKVFPHLIREFGFKVFDEDGFEYPNCSD